LKDFFLIKRYHLKIDKFEIEVIADECETCIMDWSIDNKIKIINTENNLKKEFEFYTEGPRLEFGLNNLKNEIIINCPGFSTLYIDGNNLKKIELDYENNQEKLKKFNVSWTINNTKKLIQLKETSKPSFKYE
jgi:hypothetical protein